MPISSEIHKVFGHFQNLNLLFLLRDLEAGQTAWQSWSSGRLLCPVAHGLAGGQAVRQLNVMGQAADLARGCDFAAECLGAVSGDVLRFVRSWDDQLIGRDCLTRQLQALWEERLTDAVAMQEILTGQPQSELEQVSLEQWADRPLL
jgi:hypothetical protein